MDEELYLTDLLNVEILQKMQDSFSQLTGIAALTTDANGKAVTEGSNFSDFCIMCRRSPLGRKKCEQCDRQGAEITLHQGRPATYRCHAGLVDFSAPIMANGKASSGSFPQPTASVKLLYSWIVGNFFI